MYDLFSCTASVIYVEGKEVIPEMGGGNQSSHQRRKWKVSANLFPCCNLLIIPDTGNVLRSASTRSNERSFGNGQSSCGASSLLVVF